MEKLKTVSSNVGCSLYEIERPSGLSIRRFIFSTSETQEICNDPFCVGVRYTSALRRACARLITSLSVADLFAPKEKESTVLHILRGGLNFGLREALYDALRWNSHGSAFISAQRAQSAEHSSDWYITENSYNKVYFPAVASIIFGDVVATGTSLRYALDQVLAAAEKQQVELRSICFVTIGGLRAEEILSEIDQECRARFSGYSGATIVYLEGRFNVAQTDSALSISYPGTDLLRSNALLAPEFIESQYKNPAYPIERCTIYDAGSRAFWLEEYFADVSDYWQGTLALAEKGLTYSALLKERFPELDPKRFGVCSLEDICRGQLEKCQR